MSGARVPQLRFPGFDGDWEKIPAGEIFEFRNGLNYLKNAVGDEVKVIGVGDFQSNESISDYSELNVVAVDNAAKDSILLRNGDILFVRSNGNKDLIGRTMLVKGIREPIAYSGFTIRGRISDGKVSAEFSAKSFRSDRFRNYLREMGGGTNISNLSQDIISGYSLFVPHLSEQRKIADFLGTVDAKLDALRRKKSGLEAFKSGLMQRLFSQELRFTRDDGSEFPEWEEKRLGDFLKRSVRGLVGSIQDARATGYPLIGAGGWVGSIATYQSEKPFIAVLKDGAGAGRVMMCPAKSSILGTLEGLSPTEGVDLQFAYQFLQQFGFDRFVTGSTIPHVYYRDYSLAAVSFPCLCEQRKIADALSALDAKIAAAANQITHMETFKKGLLQQMFV